MRHTVIALEQKATPLPSIGTVMLDTISSLSTPRHVLVFRVSGHRHQQHVLIALSEVDLLGVTALGASEGDSWFVVLHCATFGSQVRARRVVLAIDPRATCRSRRRFAQSYRLEPAGSVTPGAPPA